MPRWLRSSSPESNRIRRCLPYAVTSVTVRPRRSSTRGPGRRVRAPVTCRPTRCGRRPAAVRKRVSPSGTAPPPGRYERIAPRPAGCRTDPAPGFHRPPAEGFLAAAAGGVVPAQDETAVSGHEAGREESVAPRRVADRFAIDARGYDFPQSTIREERRQCPHGQLGAL